MTKERIEAVTVTLQEPIEIAGKEYKEITLKKPYAGNLRGLSITQLQTGDTEQTIRFISRVSDLPVAAIERLSLADFNSLSNLVFGFLYPKSLNDIVSGLSEMGLQVQTEVAMQA